MATLALKRRTPSLGGLPPTNLSVIDAPLPSASITNKAANQSASLYHICRSVLDKLATVEGMAEFLDSDILPPSQLTPTLSTSSSSSSTASSSEPTTPTATSGDPLSKLWSICRQGLPLCILFNALCPEDPIQIERDPNLNENKVGKAYVYHFIVSCLHKLCFPADDVFTIKDVYLDDTNGFVKVVNTINKILQLLEEKGVISCAQCSNQNSENTPTDVRGKVVLELVETERKYVHDLEILQNYMRELQSQNLLSGNIIHYLFGNLNALVDFQRRFLIQMEEMVEKPPKEQRLGLLFVQMESMFAVYEPYCANYYSAQDLVVQEAPKLQKLADILNPIYELPSMLIKPVQRICKYPLLLAELLKSTDKDWPYYAEMEDGLEAIKRVTEKVNETQRKHENDQIVEELKRRVDNLAIESYGNLLLQDKLGIVNKDTDREHCVYLFEKVLLIYKESKDAKNRLTKSNTISIKKKRRGSLQERGRIPVGNIVGVRNKSQNGSWMLTIEWKGAEELQMFTIRFRNEEQLKLWETTLNKIEASNKTHVPNTHLVSMPNPTSFQHSSYHPTFMAYDDDDEEEDELYDDDEEEYNLMRSRTSTFSTHLFHHGRTKREGSIPWMRSYERPDMCFPPKTSTSTSTVNSRTPIVDYGMYPASPPPSHPSSPTSSTRTTQSWHHRRHEEYPSPLTAKFASHEDVYPFPPPVGRSQSHSAACPMPPPLPRQSRHQHTRMRSQSSPNIHKASVQSAAAVPKVPYHPAVTGVRPVASTPRLSDATPLSPGTVRVKLNYCDNTYAIKTADQVKFAELMDKVERKIRIVGNLKPSETIRLKYRDEDGDFITINSDDDVQMAFESRGAGCNTVHLFVNL